MQRIDSQKLERMFEVAGFSDPRTEINRLHSSLLKMGKTYLKNKRMKDMWTPEYPTTNYCYVVSEYYYWNVLIFKSDDIRVKSTKIPSQPGITHWFLTINEKVFDPTADQFSDYSEIDYDNSVNRFFLQAGFYGPSERAKILAEHMQ